MTEQIPELSKEECLHCPNRNRISRLLAILASKKEFAPDCEGPVTVSRGNIVTQQTKAGEPSPDKSTWNIRIGKLDGPTLFSRIDWTKKVECGNDEIQANENEVAYPHPDGALIHAKDGKRYAAFYQGPEAGFRAHGIIRAFSNMDAETDINRP